MVNIDFWRNTSLLTVFVCSRQGLATPATVSRQREALLGTKPQRFSDTLPSETHEEGPKWYRSREEVAAVETALSNFS